MEPEEIEGTDPQQLEDAATAIEVLIAAALAAVAAQAATSMVVVPGVPAVDVNVLGSIPQWWEQRLRRRIMPALRRTVDTVTRRLRDLFDAELERLGETEVLYTGTGMPELFPADDVGPVLPLPDITAEDILAQARNRLVAIGDDLWVNARTSLVEGMQQGESVPQLAARVRAAAGVTEPRARVIARTEVISASNAASIAQARSTGIGLDKIWIATEDPRTRVTHREADGQTVPIDTEFTVGGEALDFPGDPTGRADNVINCRCSIGYRVALEPDNGITTAAVPHLHTCQEGPRPWKPGPCKGWKHDLPETDPRWKPRPEPKPARKPRAKKAVTPEVPAEPDVADTVIKQRQERQKTIDQARSRAGVLAELEQLALMEGASPRLYTQRLNARIRKDGLGDDPVVAAVADAVRTGDTQQIMAAIEEAARKAGLERIGGAPGNPDQVMPFDRTVHRPTGGDILDGVPAQVVRPGYRYRMRGEGNLLLEKATVEPVEASIVVAAAVPHLHTCREGPRPWKPGPCKGWRGTPGAPAPGVKAGKKAAAPRGETKPTALPKQAMAGKPKLSDVLGKKQSVSNAETVAQANAIYGGTFAGLTATVTEATPIEKGEGKAFLITGNITDSTGKRIGVFTRSLRTHPREGASAQHTALELASSIQGQGFAEAFNANAINYYRENDIRQIELHANVDVGGYAWARAGYDWNGDTDRGKVPTWLREVFEPGSSRRSDVTARVAQIPDDRRAEQIQLAREMHARVSGNRNAPDFPSPYEISQLGRWPGAGKDDMWVGKAIMLGSSWQGVRYL